jgi:uncharacterized protein
MEGAAISTLRQGGGDPPRLKVEVLVLKVASRCNLNCSYCFMYNLGDETWRGQPAVMSREVLDATLARVRSHCQRHGLERFHLILHGGEPLLAGEAFLGELMAAARRVLLPEVQPMVRVQTNGTLLTTSMSQVLHRLGIQVGVSLDGPRAVNDRHRLDHAGRSSYDRVIAGIENHRRTDDERFLRLLSVIDLEADPVECYEHAKTLGARSMDFLFPDATHDHPPPHLGRSETPYADWLIAIFERWFVERPRPLHIRLLEEIISTICGGENGTDLVGTGPNEVLVVETDGGIEPVDSLKVCGDGFTKLGANVLENELDDVLGTDLAQAYHLSGQRACDTCRACPLHRVCGGGFLPHRHRRQNGFDNPSVYCRDLMRLIVHIQNRLCQELPESIRQRLGLTPLDYHALRSVPGAATPRRSLPVVGAVR